MIKVVYCFARRPDLSRQTFLRHWREVHGPIGARIPGLRRLVHSAALTHTDDVRRPDYDGMAELWFDDWAALLAARRSPEWAASTADERHFIDHHRTAYFVAEEHVLPGSASP